MILGDLIIRTGVTTIGIQNRTSELLVQLDAHRLTKQSSIIEVGDVEDIIAIRLLLDIDGLRGGFTGQGLDDCFLGLTADDLPVYDFDLAEAMKPGVTQRDYVLLETPPVFVKSFRNVE